MVGGGTTGSELVAEVATDFPNAKYTLVNKPELLLRESHFLHIIFVIPLQFNSFYLYPLHKSTNSGVFHFSGGSSKRLSMHKIAMKQLNKLGVNSILDDYIKDLKEDYMGEPKKFTIKEGVEIDADVVVVRAGGYPTPTFLSLPLMPWMKRRRAYQSMQPCFVRNLAPIPPSPSGPLVAVPSTEVVEYLQTRRSLPCLRLSSISRRLVRPRPVR